jgi:hypothetical protein
MNAPRDKPPRPLPPEPGDCCGGGCVRCVFDIHDEQLEAWRAACARIDTEAAGGTPPAPPDARD